MKKIIEYIILFLVSALLLVVGVLMFKKNEVNNDDTPNMHTDIKTGENNNSTDGKSNNAGSDNSGVTSSGEVSWQIVDETAGLTCSSVMTTIYEDENYYYQVGSSCQATNIFIKYSTGEKISIKDALSSGKVKIGALLNSNINITKVAKDTSKTFEIVDETAGLMCAQTITTLYEDDNYYYKVSDSCKGTKIFVKFANGEKLTIQEALTSKKITADELISKGVSIMKESKMKTQN